MPPPHTAPIGLALAAGLWLAQAHASEPPAALSYRVHVIGHSGLDRPAQSMATGLAVASDGTCIVSSNGPGDHPAPCWYIDGQLAGRCVVPGLPGLRFTGPVAVSNTHIFAAVRVSAGSPADRTANSPASPSGIDGLWRFHRDGSPAPSGSDSLSALLPVRTYESSRPLPEAPAIAGVWTHEHEVFVSDTEAGRIRVYNTATFEESRYFKADRPSGLCVLGNQLHVIERQAVVSTFTLDGRRTGQILDEGEECVPAAVAPTPEGRLLVADAGPTRQVHFFNMSGVPTRVRTLGEPGGIQAPPAPGEVGPRRLDSFVGVGADADGNVYVAMNPPPGGCVLRAFGRDRVSLRWQSTTLAILNGVDAAPSSQGTDLLSAAGRHALDLSKPPGQSWRWVGQSNHLAPSPPHFQEKPGSPTTTRPPPPPFESTPSVCEIASHRFLAFRSADGTRLDLYRAPGHTLTPAATWETQPALPPRFRPPELPAEGPWQWHDTNGNGLIDPAEPSPSPRWRGRFPTTPIDSSGGLWSIDASTLYHWPCQGINDAGLPRLAPEPTAFQPLPESNALPDTLFFDASSSSLYLTTHASSSQETALLRFSPWPPTSPHQPPLWRIPLNHTPPSTTAPALSAAGDLAFTLNPTTGIITAYHASNGATLGQLTPPNSPPPFPHPTPPSFLRALQRPDNSYLILTQDPSAPRALAFHLSPPLAPSKQK